MTSNLLERRRPIYDLLQKLPCFSDISNSDLQFDMYCSTRFDDLSMVLKYCYIQSLLRPITTHQQIQAFIKKHYFYTSLNIDFLLRYKASECPIHTLEDSVQQNEITTMPVLGIKYRVYKWTEASWHINERFDISGRAPVCYLVEYESKFYILFTKVMSYLDQYDPQTGSRNYYDIAESYILYAEQCLFYSDNKTIEFSPKSLLKECCSNEDVVSYSNETLETKKDSESIGILDDSDRYDNWRYVRKILFSEDNGSELDSIGSERRETSCRYSRRDKYFKESFESAMNILISKYISPKVLSSSESVNYESIITSEGSSTPQLPRTLCLQSASAKGYWNYSQKACFYDSIRELSPETYDSFMSSIFESSSSGTIDSDDCIVLRGTGESNKSENNIEQKQSGLELKLRSARNECGNECLII